MTKTNTWILGQYTKKDFRGVPESVMKGAIELCEILSACPSEWIKIVPYEHVSGTKNKTAVMVIYEECVEYAERVLFGYDSAKYDQIVEIQNKYNILYECYNHWSCGVHQR